MTTPQTAGLNGGGDPAFTRASKSGCSAASATSCFAATAYLRRSASATCAATLTAPTACVRFHGEDERGEVEIGVS